MNILNRLFFSNELYVKDLALASKIKKGYKKQTLEIFRYNLKSSNYCICLRTLSLLYSFLRLEKLLYLQI